MSNGTSKPKRAMQLGGTLIAIFGLVATITAYASAQDTPSRYYSGVISGPDYCLNASLGGPRTYPFDDDRDGVADTCSLPRSRRETAARQNAMERLGGELALYFGQLFADECTKVAETFGEPAAEATDECAAPRAAHASGRALPAVPQAPIPPETTSPRFFSGPVVTSSVFCLDRSFGGPVTYPFDDDRDGVADTCALPRTRRAAVARQNAFERLAMEQEPYFLLLVSEECLRVPATFGEPRAEAVDFCATGQTTSPDGTPSGTPLPTRGDGQEEDDGTGSGGPGSGPRTPPERFTNPSNPQPVPTPPTATNPGTYNNRAARNVRLDPGDSSIAVAWDQVPTVDDGKDPVVDTDIYDSGEVYEYEVWWAERGKGWSATNREIVTGATSTTITNLMNFTTYNVRIKAVRGTGNDPFTPTLTSTPGLVGPPTWPVDDDEDTPAATDPLYSPFYGRLQANWDAPVGNGGSAILYYLVQWSTSPGGWSASRQATVPAGTTEYIIMGLTNGNYYVRVQGVSGNGPGTWSLSANYRLASTRPSPGQPTELTLAVSQSDPEDLVVTWTKPDQADPSRQPTHYNVQWRNVTAREGWSSTLRQRTVAGADTITDTIPNLTSGNQYEVRVQAINQDIAGSWSSTGRITLGEAPAPMTIQYTPGNRQFRVDWEDITTNPSVDYYNVQWGTSTGFASNCDASSACDQSSPATSEITITQLDGVDLDNNRLYYVRIQSVNSNGPGPWSSTVSVEPGTLIAPTSVSASEDTTHTRKLTVTWTSNAETGKPAVTGFKISYRSGTGNWSSPTALRISPLTTGFDITSAPSYSYTITVPTSGIEYQVRVLATNPTGDGPWSESASGTPGASAVPTNVAMSDGVTDANNRQTAQITWDAPSNGPTLVSYTVQWRTCGTSGYSCGGYGNSRTVTGSTSYVIPVTSLTNGMHYQVQVRANYASTAGNNSGYAESTNVYKVTIVDVDPPTPNDRTDDTVTVAARS